MHKNSAGILSPEMREEYRQLIYRIGLRYKSRHAANHKGISQVADALGISYGTLKSRICDPAASMAAKWVTTEQLLAARWVYDNPHAGKPTEMIPEPPRIPETMRQKIAAIIHDSPRPLNATEVLFTPNGYFGADTTRETVQNRLGEMCKEDIPLIERVGRDLYRSTDFNKGENV